jgi:hypothetical protein
VSLHDGTRSLDFEVARVAKSPSDGAVIAKIADVANDVAAAPPLAL